jgi:hypothetical protein
MGPLDPGDRMRCRNPIERVVFTRVGYQGLPRRYPEFRRRQNSSSGAAFQGYNASRARNPSALYQDS